MDIVWLAFFHKPKITIFYILFSQSFLVVFVTEHKWPKPWSLKLEWPKVWPSFIKYALEMAWNVLFLSHTINIKKVSNF